MRTSRRNPMDDRNVLTWYLTSSLEIEVVGEPMEQKRDEDGGGGLEEVMVGGEL